MVSIIPDLVKRDQLVGEGIRLLLALLEMQRVVEVRPRGQGAVVGQPVQVRGHGVDGSECRVRRRRNRRLNAVVLALVLREQRSLLLQVLFVVVVALTLLMVASIIGHVGR